MSGGRFTTAITKRPVPLASVIGHGQVAVSDTYEAVENDDYAGFSAKFANGVGVVQVSRVAAGHPNGLALEVFGDQGAAKWEQERPAEFQLMLNEGPAGTQGFRRVIIGPDHPYVAGGLPMDAPGVGLGQNEGFAYQARAFLEEVAGHRRGRLAAPLRLVRRGRAQHGGARRRHRVRRRRWSIGRGRAPAGAGIPRVRRSLR